MAVDARKLIIEIVDSSGGEGSQSKETKEESKTNLSKMLHPNKTKQTKDLAKNVLVNQAYSNTKSVIMQTIEFNLNRYFTIHEDYMNENIYNNARSSMEKIKSFGSSIISGFLFGGTTGAILAASNWVLNQKIAEQATMSSYHQGLNSTNMETSFSRTRAGLTNNSRGTEN